MDLKHTMGCLTDVSSQGKGKSGAKRERSAGHASNTTAGAAGSGSVGYSYDQVPEQPVPLKFVVQEVSTGRMDGPVMFRVD